jgi:hypothetical protein
MTVIFAAFKIFKQNYLFYTDKMYKLFVVLVATLAVCHAKFETGVAVCRKYHLENQT